MIAEYQSHSGAVNTSTTPKVQYAYSEMASGANYSRLTSITYPSGYVLTFNYSSGLNSNISRLSSLSDSTGTLEGYVYMGLGTVVERDHPQPTLTQTYIDVTGVLDDPGDNVKGLDRFGRVQDAFWYTLALWVPSTAVTVSEFRYSYDADGNVTSKSNMVNYAFGESYGYDGLNQLVSFSRSVSHTQSFDYDALGNFNSVTTNMETPVTRTANHQNEITSIGGATTPVYDANGNMTGDETGKTFVYDAWNRLIAVKSGATTLETLRYDGDNRRVTNTIGSTTTDLYYSSQWQVLEEQVSGSDVDRYVWSSVYVDALVLRDRDTDANGSLDERLWPTEDANWNVMALVDGSGSVAERYVYDPFGAATIYSPT